MFDSGRSYFLGRSHIRLAPIDDKIFSLATLCTARSDWMRRLPVGAAACLCAVPCSLRLRHCLLMSQCEGRYRCNTTSDIIKKIKKIIRAGVLKKYYSKHG